MAKLGNYNLFVISESPQFSVETTSYPVEKGIAFTDHVKPEPETMQLEVFLYGNDHQKQLDQLKSSMYKGEIMNYAGRFIMRNVIIEDISPNASDIVNGITVTIKLKQIRIVTTPYVKPKPQVKKPTNSGKKQPTPKKPASKNKPVYHITKRGDTYWGLSKKYGTSISQLRKWNKYPDRKIPIGVKLRVK
ncbi:LysM peptidoglycan-binding domain-containing protein [Aeribacillus pallidus]|uniref:LysM peptidoglycan-binding domain-containing protein n=1 Tax=Aeribacillus pallidus TaxID=33936 RepID=UPI000E3425F7|nr:LysM peptidoglycan-binding domain-containing protein [Aeribacillus pallidus]